MWCLDRAGHYHHEWEMPGTTRGVWSGSWYKLYICTLWDTIYRRHISLFIFLYHFLDIFSVSAYDGIAEQCLRRVHRLTDGQQFTIFYQYPTPPPNTLAIQGYSPPPSLLLLIPLTLICLRSKFHVQLAVLSRCHVLREYRYSPWRLGEGGSVGYEVYRPRSDRPRDPNPSLCRQIYGKMLQYIVYICIFYIYRIYIYI